MDDITLQNDIMAIGIYLRRVKEVYYLLPCYGIIIDLVPVLFFFFLDLYFLRVYGKFLLHILKEDADLRLRSRGAVLSTIID